jgi:hypothetical protein
MRGRVGGQGASFATGVAGVNRFVTWQASTAS